MTPTVQIYQGREPDLPAATVNVVIDVLRAFTTTHVAFERGCDEILLAETVDEAFRLSESHPDYLLAGERDARRVEGFDAGNSPYATSDLEFESGAILTTSNGVRATLNALGADEVVVTGWTNTPATLAHLDRLLDAADEPRVNLVASHPVSDEDVACADFIAARLEDRTTPSARRVVDRIRTARSAQKFYSRQFHLRDLDLACRRRPADYAMIVDLSGQTPRLLPRRG